MDPFRKLLSHPLGTARRLLEKKLVEPRRYRTQGGYDAERYWRERFQRHGPTLRAVGDEGLSVEQNRLEYATAAKVFDSMLDRVLDSRPLGRVLEVGVGTGFYTDLIAQRRPSAYLGIDVTDVLFDELRSRYSDFRFERRNVVDELPAGPYDTLIMLDVIEHIVAPEELGHALSNLEAVAARGAHLLLAPTYPRGRRHLYYVRQWTTDEVLRRLRTGTVQESASFREGVLLDISF